MLTIDQLQRIDNIKSKLSNYVSKQFRDGQTMALDFILNSRKKFKVICAPTGSGKSLMAMVAGMLQNRFIYLCSSKQLQMQLESDFPYPESDVMWGRNNFQCNLTPAFNADSCPYAGTVPKHLMGDKDECKARCNYELKKKRVLGARVQILNYQYHIFEANYVGRFSDRPVIVCDEADTLEKHLANFIKIRISARLIGKLRLNPPKYKTATSQKGIPSWIEWADEVLDKILIALVKIGKRIEGLHPEDDACLRLKKDESILDNLVNKLRIFKDNVDKEWLFEEKVNKDNELIAWEFKPTWIPPELAYDNFFRHTDEFIMLSATFPPMNIFAKTLGIELSDIDYVEIPSTFPVENRKVMLVPSGDMAYKTYNESLPSVIEAVKDILRRHPNDKGIIHTVSWRLNMAIIGIRDKRLLTHNSKDKNTVLDKFIRSKHPLVFVSPSSTRGIDLDGDKCRFSIIVKTPYQSLKDKLVNARVYGGGSVGQVWYMSDAAQEIVQAVGRGVRSEDDYCITYILDTNAVNKVVDSRGLFPRYFIDAMDV